MLRTLVQLRPSPIHGLGIYTVYNLRKGDMVWEYDPIVDYRLLIDDQVCWPWSVKFLETYGYTPHGKKYFEVPGDAAMFMNHSDLPNCYEAEPDITRAAHDIVAGTELTCNYWQIDSRFKGCFDDYK